MILLGMSRAASRLKSGIADTRPLQTEYRSGRRRNRRLPITPPVGDTVVEPSRAGDTGVFFEVALVGKRVDLCRPRGARTARAPSVQRLVRVQDPLRHDIVRIRPTHLWVLLVDHLSHLELDAARAVVGGTVMLSGAAWRLSPTITRGRSSTRAASTAWSSSFQGVAPRATRKPRPKRRGARR